ncbi:MAG: hypothetical protein FK734_08535 [Asgard group archaeon]|nr:hypothetical protein [Asgard group archaeon]
MSKKNHLLLAFFSVILIISVNTTSILSYEYDFDVGKQYPFTTKNYFYGEESIPDEEKYIIEEDSIEMQLNFNITSMDIENKLMDFTYYSPDGHLNLWDNYYFDMSFYEFLFESTNDFFYINFDWDSEAEVIRLIGFDIALWYTPLFFVEPNWELFNNGLLNVFNGSSIVDSLDTPTEYVVIPFEYFLAIMNSYSINNKNSLSNAINQFTDTNTEIVLHFDLSKVIYDRYYDGESMGYKYQLFDVYKIDLQISYSDGGLLKKFLYRGEASYELEGVFFKEIYEYSLTSESQLAMGVPTFIILPALIVSVFIIKFSMNSKRKEEK